MNFLDFRNFDLKMQLFKHRIYIVTTYISFKDIPLLEILMSSIKMFICAFENQEQAFTVKNDGRHCALFMRSNHKKW